MSATRIKTDKGEGNINGMKTAEKRLEPNLQQGSANELTVAQQKLDMNNDGTLTGADFKMLGNKSKKRTA
jgi:hypothetical protein